MSESHCIRFVTAASETRFCASGGVCGLIVMAAWGCGAVITSRCGEGLRLALILVVALHTDQAKLRGSPLRRSKATRAAYGTGQPLDTITSCSTLLLKTGQPPSTFLANPMGTVRTTNETAYSSKEKDAKPVPRPVINLEQFFLRWYFITGSARLLLEEAGY